MIPAEAKQRSFDATVDNGLVTLRSGVFLEGLICTFDTGLGCNQFKMTQDGDSVAISIQPDSEWHGGQIVERLPSGTWYELSASGAGRAEGPRIEATLKGSLWYCPNNVSYPFPCFQFVGCGVSSLRMTIVKKD